MDATNLGGQVKDLVQNLASSETYKHANAVRTTFAPDAVLTTPLYKATGTEHIRDMLNLHYALTTDTSVSGIEWDDKAKTATFALSSTYSLAHAPFPLSLARIFAFNVKTPDVTVALQPDESHPVRSDATEPTRYLVSRVVAPSHPPKTRIIAAVYPVILFVVRLVAPIVIDTLVVVHKFFVRHPLKDGVIRTTTAAVCEIVGWVLTSVRSRIPFIGKPAAVTDKNERADPTVDVPSIPSSPAVTSAPLPSARKAEPKAEKKKPEAKKEPETKKEPEAKKEAEPKKEAKAEPAKEESEEDIVQDKIEAKLAEIDKKHEEKSKEETKKEAKEEPKKDVKEEDKKEVKEEPKEEDKTEAKPEPAQEKSEDDVVQDKIEAKLAEIEKKHENKPKEDHKPKEHKEHKEHKEAKEHKANAEEHPEEHHEAPSFADVTAHEPALDQRTAENFPTLAATTGELSAAAPPPTAVDPNSDSTFANVAEAAPPSASSEGASPSEASANGSKSSKNKKKKSNKKGARK